MFMRKYFMALILFLLWIEGVRGQEVPPQSTLLGANVLEDVTQIGLLGASGAILGLSTLSFVQHPGKHASRILIGGALGVIFGVGFVAWNQANKTRLYYYEAGSPLAPDVRGNDYLSESTAGSHYTEMVHYHWSF